MRDGRNGMGGHPMSRNEGFRLGTMKGEREMDVSTDTGLMLLRARGEET